ncbi:MAG TPA: Fic family protein [Candidatus Nanoarchaeia archaeon]|nr:Fic family protein [Candidatus Nanoarchaeia archaeon]
MVYIYKKIIGAAPYYYLRASERKGRRVVAKDIAYLGGSIEEVRKSLDNLPKYKEKIRKAYRRMHSFIESNHYLEKAMAMKLKKDPFLVDKLQQIEACKLHYNSVFRKLDEATKKEVFKDFIIEFIFNTAAIEGNTITLQQVRNFLEEGLTPKNKTLREIYDLQNSEKVFSELLGSSEELSHELIIKIHTGLMANIDARKGYRTTDVRVIKANFKATPAPYVKTDMDILLKWYEDNETKMHPLVVAAVFHHKLEKIHPFMDGNGRTGRMILNYLLMKNSYPPVVIHRKFRSEYLDALRNADSLGLNSVKKEGYSMLIKFIADELNEYYWSIFL